MAHSPPRNPTLTEVDATPTQVDVAPGAQVGVAAPAPALPPPLAIGDRVGEYTIEESRAHGGFGTVYRARTDAGATVAVKLLHYYLAKDARTARRFAREAAAMQRITHPGVVRVHEVGTAPDGRMYIAMEWIEGTTLQRHVADHGPLTPQVTRAVVEELGDALSAAHAAGVVHRDLKLSNIMLTERDGATRTVIVDFGIAKLFEPDTGHPLQFTSTAAVLGSPHTMAPEQIRGEPVDARTDVYALGAVVYALLTGGYPFTGSSRAELKALHLSASVPRPSARAAVSASVDAAIIRCLAKHPADRYPTVPDAVDALGTALSDVSAPQSATFVSEPIARGRALGVYVEVRLDPDSLDSVDDTTFNTMDEVSDRLRQALTAAGLSIVAETGSGMLAVAPLPDDADSARDRRAEILRFVVPLAADGRAQLTNTAIQLGIAVHAGTVTTGGRDGDQLVGGDLLELHAWTATDRGGEVVATNAALHGVEAEFETAIDSPNARRVLAVRAS